MIQSSMPVLGWLSGFRGERIGKRWHFDAKQGKEEDDE